MAVRGYDLSPPKPKRARRYFPPTGGWIGSNAFNFSVGQNVKELPECAWKEKREALPEVVRPGRGKKVSALTKIMEAYPVRLPRLRATASLIGLGSHSEIDSERSNWPTQRFEVKRPR